MAPAAWNLRDAIAQIAQAAWSVGSAGTEAQQAKALEILHDARRRLYTILAEADGRPPRRAGRSGLTVGRRPTRAVAGWTVTAIPRWSLAVLVVATKPVAARSPESQM